ncbi:MAG: TraR/DksA family transcriptional regulator [Minisyncoccota bacterium]
MNIESHTQKLEEEKARLESEMASIGRKNPAVPGDWEPVPPEVGGEADLVDQADVIVSRDTTTAIFTDLESRYDSVLAALSRIEKGTYGVCEVCGRVIEEARLSADPTATTCIEHLK